MTDLFKFTQMRFPRVGNRQKNLIIPDFLRESGLKLQNASPQPVLIDTDIPSNFLIIKAHSLFIKYHAGLWIYFKVVVLVMVI